VGFFLGYRVMSRIHVVQTPILCAIVFLFALPLQAINITLDYQYDTNNFFGAGNPDGATAGAEAMATLEAVADYYSGILTDTFSTIQTPAPFGPGQFGGTAVWQWSLNFNDPQTGSSTTLYDETIAADEYRIYVGARSLSGNTLGVGGPGGFGWSSTPSGGFSPSEIAQLNQTTDDFSDAVENREETSGFANWGGAVTFDSDAGTNWHYNHTTQPSPGSNDNDFFSVAVHEVGHALGLGTSDEWNALVSDPFFFGSASQAEYGSPVPLACSGGCGHWAEGTMSTIYGTATSQEAALDPTVTTEERKQLTTLDAAGLTDLGWSVVPPVIFDPADYNEDGYVDATDLATWENWFGINGNGSADGDSDTDGLDFLLWQQGYTGPPPAFSGLTTIPEPSSLALGAMGVLLYLRRRRNHR